MLVLAVCIAVIAVVQVICVLALIDQYRGLLQIRANLGLIDASRSIELAAIDAGVMPSAVGLPATLDFEDRTVVVFLSTRCSTCRTIGLGLQGQVREPLWVVLEGQSSEAWRWLSEMRLSGERIVEDADGEIGKRVGLGVVPSALVFERGRLMSAETVPSVRQLQRVVGQPVSKRSRVPKVATSA